MLLRTSSFISPVLLSSFFSNRSAHQSLFKSEVQSLELNNMRVLLYSYNYYPEPIGIAPLMTELAEGLVKRGHQVRVVTAMPNYPEREIYAEY